MQAKRKGCRLSLSRYSFAPLFLPLSANHVCCVNGSRSDCPTFAWVSWRDCLPLNCRRCVQAWLLVIAGPLVCDRLLGSRPDLQCRDDETRREGRREGRREQVMPFDRSSCLMFFSCLHSCHRMASLSRNHLPFREVRLLFPAFLWLILCLSLRTCERDCESK